MVTAELETADRPLAELLHRRGGLSIRELCEEMEVTATAVRQRLGRLEAAGFVSKTTTSGGRGRPSHSYSLTESGRRQLGDNYSELAMLLWQELLSEQNPELRSQRFERLRDLLVKRYGAEVRSESLPERIQELSQVLRGFGFSVEVDTSGDLPILRERFCPYHEVASEDRSICDLEQAVFSEILGAELQLSSCCQQGHSCCEFEPKTE